MLTLKPHDATPALPGVTIEAEARRDQGGRLSLHFSLSAPFEALEIPSLKQPSREDELWRHSCFEAFIMPEGGEGYVELNLSPSSEWAAYSFVSYREGMRPMAVEHLAIEVEQHEDRFELRAELQISSLINKRVRVGLSAVIEERSGAKSYWALSHPADRPDFHHPDSFVHELP